GVVDLISMKALVWPENSEDGQAFAKKEIPSDLLDEAQYGREVLLEALAEVDDTFMEGFLEGKAATEAEIVAAARRAVVGSKLIPVFCGTAFKNKGIQPLLDAVIRYLPSPLDLGDVKGFDV